MIWQFLSSFNHTTGVPTKYPAISHQPHVFARLLATVRILGLFTFLLLHFSLSFHLKHPYDSDNIMTLLSLFHICFSFVFGYLYIFFILNTHLIPIMPWLSEYFQVFIFFITLISSKSNLTPLIIFHIILFLKIYIHLILNLYLHFFY